MPNDTGHRRGISFVAPVSKCHESKNESKHVLLSHLEDLKFVDDNFKLKGYRCCACKKLPIMHCIANCGDPFCNACYLEHYKKPCPYCKETVEKNSQDPEFERAVFDFKVDCKFKKNGCEVIVELKHFLNHISMCTFATEKLLPQLHREDPIADRFQKVNDDVSCIKQLLKAVQAENSRICCEFQEMKDSLKSNVELQATKLKEVTDEIRHKELLQAEAMQLKIAQMINESSKVLQEDNNNQIKGLVELMQTDSDTLQLMETFKKSDEVAENELRNETSTEIMQKEIMEFKNALKKSEETTEILEAEHKREILNIKYQQMNHFEEHETKFFVQFGKEINEYRYLRKGDFIGSPPVVALWKVDNIWKKFQKKQIDTIFSKMTVEECMCKDFFNCYDGVKFTPTLYKRPEVHFISIALKRPPLKHQFMKHFQYSYLLTYILLDQSNALETRDIKVFQNQNNLTTTINNDLPIYNRSVRFFSYSLLEGDNRYIKNDQILIKIILEPLSFLYNNVASSNGILLWRIKNYSKKKQNLIDEVQNYLISKPFKTSEKGYLLRVELYLNVHGSFIGQNLFLVLRVLKGENDAYLPSEFAYQYSCFILDHSDSFPKTDLSLGNDSFNVSQDDSSKRFKNLGLLSQAENEKYRKDDSLLLKVIARVL